MKKIFSIIGALLAGAAMFSCATPDENLPALGTTITVTPNTVEEEVDGNGATLEFEVACDGQWMAMASEWMTLDTAVGNGNATVKVTVEANMDVLAPTELAAPRSGKITFMVSKETYVEVEIAQAGDPLKLVQELPFEETFEESQGMFTIENESLEEGLTYVWAFDSAYGMKASAYAGSAKAAISYLVSPILNMSIEAVLTFDHAGKYFVDVTKDATLWVREVGGEWSQLEIPVYCDSWTFVSSGEISLAEYKDKKIQLGWRYESTSAGACTWEIKNVKVAAPEADDNGGESGDENGDDNGENGDDNGEGGDDNGEEPEQPAEKTYVTLAELLASTEAMAENTYVKVMVVSNSALNTLTSMKNIHLQDATAGLGARFTANHEFAFGDELEINVSGMSVTEYNGAKQLNNVPNDKTVVLSQNNTIEAKVVSMADYLDNKYESQYIALEGVQVVEADLAKTWAVSDQSAHTSITLEDAEGNTFVAFTSKYAATLAKTVGQGSGTIKGISSINNGTMQIVFAQESDVDGLTGERF